VAGFTSFVAHAGGPPFQVYALPLRLDPKVLTGTSVIFFAVVNAVKVAPYAALGFFDARTLLTALVLLPVAVVAVLVGAAVVKRMRAEVFYPFMYVMVALVGLRLVWDGARGLLGRVARPLQRPFSPRAGAAPGPTRGRLHHRCSLTRGGRPWRTC
jgi:uncharacterized protein